MTHESSTAASSLPSPRNHRRRLRHRHSQNIDLISSLPDEILQHILFFVPTKLAIRTSVLSKRWRHVWSDTPCLIFDFDDNKLHAAAINQTLTRYTAPKMMKFHLKSSSFNYNCPDIYRWIEFAMSRSVENLSLCIGSNMHGYKFPDSFYINSSIKQLSFHLHFPRMIPGCSVSWTSLQKLSLRSCIVSDESFAKILSGSPILESLTLCHCQQLTVLDLSKSLRLRTLEITCDIDMLGPRQIVAPHIHCLRLHYHKSPCTFVDLSSLTEAKVEFNYFSVENILEPDLLQVMLKMLEKLKNAEKLTFGSNLLQILSLVEVCGVPFPMFKTKYLTLETDIFQYVIPGIERLLQNSPDLKMVTVRASDSTKTISGSYIDNYLNLQGLDPDLCWRSKDGDLWNKCRWKLRSENVASFLKLILKKTKTLDKLAVQLSERYHRFNIKELVQTLSQCINNVSIMLSIRTNAQNDTAQTTTQPKMKNPVSKPTKQSNPLQRSPSSKEKNRVLSLSTEGTEIRIQNRFDVLGNYDESA